LATRYEKLAVNYLAVVHLAMIQRYLRLAEPASCFIRQTLDVPLAASLAHRLRARGIPLEGDILTETDLREAIAALLRPMTVKKERPG
jgi:hypothetical protein